MASTSLTDARHTLDPFRYGKAYTVVQAASLANLAPVVIRAWISNAAADESDLGCSFLDVIELAVIVRLCPMGAMDRLVRLRRVHAVLADRFGLAHPFASRALHESGGATLHRFDMLHPDEPPIAVDIGGSWALPGAVSHLLQDIDYSQEDGLAERWFPAGRETPIVLDPRMAGGRLTVAGRGVTIATIHQRFLAGESIEYLADDYEIDEATIEDAIRIAARGELAVA